MTKQKILQFPKDFLWGVSTSAYQIEGGAVNDWSRWEGSETRKKRLENESKKVDDFICGRACDSYHRYEEDLDLVKNLNCGAYRLGLEWSRIEPEPGKFDQAAIEHYRKILGAFRSRGLKAVVTLWHWTSPVWFADRGGWSSLGAAASFGLYCRLVVRELGDLIDYWLTVNEPMVYLANGYIKGKWPPHKKSIIQACQAHNHLAKAHEQSYRLIHQHSPRARVGLTMLTNYFEPAGKNNLPEIILSKLANYIWNDRFVRKLHGHYDFLGLDYYFHDRMVWWPPFVKNLNQEVTDLGWEIYPAGIYWVLKNYAKFKKPLFVMENGLADAADSQRAGFIVNHLRYLHQALNEGVDVRGYFHWSLLDNFEWSEGFGPKFGLYAVDRQTLARRPRPSAKTYSEICKNNQIELK